MTMMDRVFELPRQLAWGSGLAAPELPRGRPIVLIGMGGSAMAAAVGALAAEPTAPIVVHRTYGLPGWAVPSGAIVVAVSYSGNTEETLTGVEAALAAGLPVAIVTSGGVLADLAAADSLPVIEVPDGLQPRAGVGYQAAAVVRMLEGSGIVEDGRTALEEAADVVAAALDDGRGPAAALGRDIAAALSGRIAVVYGGAGVGALAAYRWKTQINENAKVPAFVGEVPELNHNELEGWNSTSLFAARSLSLVYLRDRADHPQVARRFELTDAMLPDGVARAGTVASEGSGPLARFFSLAVVGDVASVAMATDAGVAPGPVDRLESFKRQLRGDPE